jgi:hypothetical protein
VTNTSGETALAIAVLALLTAVGAILVSAAVFLGVVVWGVL